MNIIKAFTYLAVQNLLNTHKKLMVFDWDAAARLIIKKGTKHAAAGLRSDWAYTGGDILQDGKPIPKSETYTYLASTWAIPEIEIDGNIYECYKMQREVPGWDAVTYWPESALKILKKGE